MSIENLQLIVPAPEGPVYAGLEQSWGEIEREIGTSLPEDYKQLINIYGLGCFGNYVYPLNPFVSMPGPGSRLRFQHGPEFVQDYADMYQAPDGSARFPAFPSLNGLLPWGMDDNGGLVCWRVSGKPQTWPNVVIDYDWSDEHFEFASSATDFLSDWLTGRIKISHYPSPDQPLFRSY